MPITWRPAKWTDIEPGLSIQNRNRGDALVHPKAALDAWRFLAGNSFFASAVLEANPTIGGHHMIGFGASVMVSDAFANAEIANPRPDINSRLIAAIHSGLAVLASSREVARANAREGVQILILYGNWRDEALTPDERHAVQTVLATSFTEWHAGYRILRVLSETADEPAREFLRRSVVYETVGDFQESGRVLFSMTRQSVKEVPGSLGNVLFSFREPVLRLRYSDQQLLSSALSGLTDQELAVHLGIKYSAVKARWRSVFDRIADAVPGLLNTGGARGGRGTQKRHRVLAYVRSHAEEVRPYDWKARLAANSMSAEASNGCGTECGAKWNRPVSEAGCCGHRIAEEFNRRQKVHEL